MIRQVVQALSALVRSAAAKAAPLWRDVKAAYAAKKLERQNAAAGVDRAKLTGRFARRCLTGMVVWFAVLVGGLVLGVRWADDRIWYGTETSYGLLNMIEDNIELTLIALFAGGAAAIIYYHWHKTLVYIDDIAAAAEQLVSRDARAIELPADLHRIETRLNEAKTRAIEAELLAAAESQRKNDLLVYLAHDLKTPLTSVIGYLQLLHDEQDVSPELRRKYESVALDRSLRLEDLINEFFEVSRLNLSESSLELRGVNLTRMVEQELFEFKPLMDEKGLTYELQATPDLRIRCDIRKIERVLANLLRNAVNYSWPNTQVAVSLEPQVKDGVPGVELRIRNHGSTIAPEQLDRLFEQFYRLSSSRDSATGGSGLGLAISRGLVRAHGGTICAQSAHDTVTFTTWLPLNPKP